MTAALFDVPEGAAAVEQERPAATFSPCRDYRYTLFRRWRPAEPRDTVLWVMLNPSTADERVLDPTVRRCRSFSERWGFGALVVCNLFALRATDPAVMKAHREPVGPDNDRVLEEESRQAGVTVAAWGVHGGHLDRWRQVAPLLTHPRCLGATKDGHPRHPLYVPGTTRLVDFCTEGL